MTTLIKLRVKRKSPLVALVLSETKKNPFHYLGVDWAAIAQPELARQLEISVATLKRQVRDQRLCTCSTSRPKQWLIRVGAPVTDKTHAAIAKEMSTIWNRKLRALRKQDIAELVANGKSDEAKELEDQRIPMTSPHEFGCMNGLAEVWPKGFQTDIFEHALKDWVAVMAAIKIANDALPVESQCQRYYDYPVISLMRKFPNAVYEAWELAQQAAGSMKACLNAA